jgi:hypothetical protein
LIENIWVIINLNERKIKDKELKVTHQDLQLNNYNYFKFSYTLK